MKNIVLFALLCWLPVAMASALDEYEVSESSDQVTFLKENGATKITLSLVEPKYPTPTTKAYAQFIMDSYRGWDLVPVIDLRGFVFKYTDNAPCVGLVSYFDGRSFLLFQSCGRVSKDELASVYKEAKNRLKIDELLRKQSKPNRY